MLPEFRKAMTAVNAEVRRQDKLHEKVVTYGDPRPTTARRKKRSSAVPPGVPEGGHSGGDAGTGSRPTDQA